MAEPLSSNLVKSNRNIVHSDNFEGYKLIQTNSQQLILLDLNILYWYSVSHDQIKPSIAPSCEIVGKDANNKYNETTAWNDRNVLSTRNIINQKYFLSVLVCSVRTSR